MQTTTLFGVLGSGGIFEPLSPTNAAPNVTGGAGVRFKVQGP